MLGLGRASCFLGQPLGPQIPKAGGKGRRQPDHQIKGQGKSDAGLAPVQAPAHDVGGLAAIHQERHVIVVGGGHAGGDETGTNDADGDVVAGQPAAQALAPGPHRRLGCRIGRAPANPMKDASELMITK